MAKFDLIRTPGRRHPRNPPAPAGAHWKASGSRRKSRHWRTKAKELKRVLASEDALRELVVGEIEADAKTYGDERRTLIEEAQITKVAAPVSDEPVTVFISQRFWVRTRQGHGHRRALASPSRTATAWPPPTSAAPPTTASSSAATDACAASPSRSCPPGAATARRWPPSSSSPPARRSRTPSAAKSRNTRADRDQRGLRLPLLHRRHGRAAPRRANSSSPWVRMPSLRPLSLFRFKSSLVAVLSNQGRLLLFLLSELKALPGGGKGMMLLDLKTGDALSGCKVINEPSVTLLGNAGSKVQQLALNQSMLQTYFGGRARAGKVIETKLKALRLS